MLLYRDTRRLLKSLLTYEGGSKGATESVVVREKAAGGDGAGRRRIALAAGRRDRLVGQGVAGARTVDGANGRVGGAEGTGAGVDEAVVNVAVLPVVDGRGVVVVVEAAAPTVPASFTVATQMPDFSAFGKREGERDRD